MDIQYLQCCYCTGKGKRLKYSRLLEKQRIGFFAHPKHKCDECLGDGVLRKRLKRHL